MTEAKGHILPFFIPHLGCPNQCIFCDQKKIAGKDLPPTSEDIRNEINKYYEDFGIKAEIAFYGGSFTALDEDLQKYYLEPAKDGVERGFLSGIRVSTRPDCIDEDTIALLKSYGVATVELGVQSMDNKVLEVAKRGHTKEDAINAVNLLKNNGFKVGVQLMPGLPRETFASTIKGAERLLSLKPHMLRIYPTVVIKGTDCAEMFENGDYEPLDLPAAAEISAALQILAAHHGVEVIRTGLQATDTMADEVLAGAYHPAFGAMVQSEIWCNMTLDLLKKVENPKKITVNQRNLSAFLGLNRQNTLKYGMIKDKLEFKCGDLPLGCLRITDESGVEVETCLQDFMEGEYCRLMVEYVNL